MTKHNVYSCPDSFQVHDATVDAFAPRNEEGKIPKVCRIAARVVADPNGPAFPSILKTDQVQAIMAYIRVAKHLNGILDGGENYRFCVLVDLKVGILSHAPKLVPAGPAHVYLSMQDLLGGSTTVHSLK